jgi:hypothetical protein
MDKCSQCTLCYEHLYYSTLTKEHYNKKRCKMFGHKELNQITEQEKSKCELMNKKSG